jgi:hypothetical protein
MAPHVTDDRTCYFFATKEKALEAVRQRKWRLYNPPASLIFLRFIVEFTVVCVLLSPVVYQLFKEPTSFLLISAPALCINPYTTAVTTVMFSAFAYPFIKVVLLMATRPKSDFALGPFVAQIITYLVLTWGFCFLFMGMLPNVPTATETLEVIEANRAEMVARHQIFPGMTVAEYYHNGPHIHPNGDRDFNYHATDPEFADAQRAYARLKAQAAQEAKYGLKGQHIYKVILNKANDLWIERQARKTKKES